MTQTLQNNIDAPHLSFRLPENFPGMAVYEANLIEAAPFQASRWTVEPGCGSPVDSHSVHEIWLVARGSGELHYGGATHRVAAKDIVYFQPPEPHQVFNDGEEMLEIFSIWWHDAGNL